VNITMTEEQQVTPPTAPAPAPVRRVRRAPHIANVGYVTVERDVTLMTLSPSLAMWVYSTEWGFSNHDLVKKVASESVEHQNHDFEAMEALPSPDKTLAVASHDNMLFVLEASRRAVRVPAAPRPLRAPIRGLAPNTKKLVILGMWMKDVQQVLDLEQSKVVWSNCHQGVNRLRFHPNSPSLLYYSTDKGDVGMFDIRTKEVTLYPYNVGNTEQDGGVVKDFCVVDSVITFTTAQCVTQWDTRNLFERTTVWTFDKNDPPGVVLPFTDSKIYVQSGKRKMYTLDVKSPQEDSIFTTFNHDIFSAYSTKDTIVVALRKGARS
jgi:hypothetical protein